MAVTQPVGRFKVELKSLNCDGWHGVALWAASATLLLPAVGGDAARIALRYDRNALAMGEWWRALTAHFVHLSFEHAALNTAGLVLMWALFARCYTAGRWLIVVLSSMLAIDLGLWFHEPHLAWYVGSSGVLHGIMAAGSWARRGEFDGWILITFLIAKLAYEQFAGAMPFSGHLGPVVVNAHLYGALGGFAAALYNRGFSKGSA